jgi:hypothetical protein
MSSEFLEERLILAKRLVWCRRKSATGQIFSPAVVYGFRKSDGKSVELKSPGKIIVMAAQEELFLEEGINISHVKGDMVIDSYWDVMPLGWFAVCPQTKSPLIECYVYGPELVLSKSV